MQLVPVEMRTNPHSNPAHTIEARIEVPPHIQTMLKTLLRQLPFERDALALVFLRRATLLMLARDVNQARSAMNFSDWTSRPGTAMGLLAASCAGVQSRTHAAGQLPSPPSRVRTDTRRNEGVLCLDKVRIAPNRLQTGGEPFPS